MKNVFSLILIALSVGVIFMYIMPEYSSLSALRTTKASYESALASAKQLQSVRDTLLNSYNSISDTDKANLAKMIPSAFDPVKLVSDISTDAAQYGMTINQVKISDAASVSSNGSRTSVTSASTASTYQTMQISFTTTGTYASFTKFLKDMESSIQLLDLQKLGITSSRLASTNASTNTSANATPQLQFDVAFNTYTTQ